MMDLAIFMIPSMIVGSSIATDLARRTEMSPWKLLVCVVSVAAQEQKPFVEARGSVKPVPLPPGGPAPRMSDGKPVFFLMGAIHGNEQPAGEDPWFAVPLCATLWASLLPNDIVSFDPPGPENYLYVLTTPAYVAVVERTIETSLCFGCRHSPACR